MIYVTAVTQHMLRATQAKVDGLVFIQATVGLKTGYHKPSDQT